MNNYSLGKKNIFGLMTIVCMAAFFLSNISYLPYFTNSGMTQMLSYPGWAMVGVAILIYRQYYLSSRDLKFVVILLAAVCVMATVQGLANKNYYSSLLTKCFLIAMFILLLGGMVARTGRTWGEENSLFVVYIISTTVLCVVVYFRYLIGQDLSSPIYSYGSKNETAFLAAASVIMLLWMKQKKETKLHTLVKCALLLFFSYIIACMRCRSMLVAIAVMFVFYLFQKNVSKGIKAFIILGFIALLIALRNPQFYDNFVNNILFAQRDSNDINDLSSGRVDQIAYAWQMFKQNILLGTGDTRTVDCFYVSALMQYGLILGGVLVLLGVYPVIWGICNYRKIKTPACMIMIFCALAFAIGGIFEENAPFGPGVRCYISWFLFGYLRVQQAHGYFGGMNHEENRTA